jgi:hypothetical protein
VPPLRYEAGRFALIYALSAFSRMLEPLQKVWIRELRRLLAPGGLLVVSLLGEGFRYRLGPGERRVYYEGELVVEMPLTPTSPAGRSSPEGVARFHPRGPTRGASPSGTWSQQASTHPTYQGDLK